MLGKSSLLGGQLFWLIVIGESYDLTFHLEQGIILGQHLFVKDEGLGIEFGDELVFLFELPPQHP